MKQYHPQAPKDYKFVGNGFVGIGVPVSMESDLDMLYLKPAYDIYGKEISNMSSISAVFVHKKDYETWNNRIEAEVGKIKRRF